MLPSLVCLYDCPDLNAPTFWIVHVFAQLCCSPFHCSALAFRCSGTHSLPSPVAAPHLRHKHSPLACATSAALQQPPCSPTLAARSLGLNWMRSNAPCSLPPGVTLPASRD